MLGCWKLAQLALTWAAGGAYVPLSQAMLGMQLGGACYTHVVVEKKGVESCIAASAFMMTAYAVQIMHGYFSWPIAIAVQCIAASAGYAAGYLVSSLGRGSKAPASRV